MKYAVCLWLFLSAVGCLTEVGGEDDPGTPPVEGASAALSIPFPGLPPGCGYELNHWSGFQCAVSDGTADSTSVTQRCAGLSQHTMSTWLSSNNAAGGTISRLSIGRTSNMCVYYRRYIHLQCIDLQGKYTTDWASPPGVTTPRDGEYVEGRGCVRPSNHLPGTNLKVTHTLDIYAAYAWDQLLTF